MQAHESKGKWALVTGASSGIGTHFARQLADLGVNLVITARRKERLDTLADELRQKGVKVEVIASDLSAAGSAEALYQSTEGAGKRIDFLINNAGFGTQNAFVEIPWEKTAEQIQLNITTLTETTWRWLRVMRERGGGHIMNVASIGAWLPVANYATYAAGKAYVRNFTEALAFEERGSGVVLTCLCPGATSTEFTDVAGHDVAAWQQKFFMPADTCAQIGLRAMFGGKVLKVAGLMNAVMMASLRLFPRRALAWIAAKVM